MPAETRSTPLAASAGNPGQEPSRPPAMTALETFLHESRAVKQFDTRVPKINSTPGTITNYAINGRELLVHTWAGGQLWKIYGELKGIPGAEKFLAEEQD